jgi:predicted PurR-regulated permease PerM
LRQRSGGTAILDRPSQQRQTEPGFLGKVLLIVLVLALAFAVWQLALVFILGFGAIIVAVTLDSLSAPVAERLKMPQHWALALTTTVLFVISIGFLATFGTRAADQFTLLAAQLPGAWAETRDWLDSWDLGRWLLSFGESAASGASSTIISALPLASGLLGWLANIALIIVIGIYLAADPGTYVDGAIRLLPPSRRKRGRQIINAAGEDLR